MQNRPRTFDFIEASRILEARRLARNLVSIRMLTTPGISSGGQKLLRRIYQRLCD